MPALYARLTQTYAASAAAGRRSRSKHTALVDERMAHDVFISYSSQDKLVADAVCATLEAYKLRCWIAPRDVLPSARWSESIVRAINASGLMVLIFSANANHSQHVMNEVERAVSAGIPILPLRIEDVRPSEGLELFIMGRHWLDAMTPPVERHLERLTETVSTLLRHASPEDGAAEQQPAGAEAGLRTSVTAAPDGPERRRSDSRRPAGVAAVASSLVAHPLWLVAAGALLVIVVGAVVIWSRGSGASNGATNKAAVGGTAVAGARIGPQSAGAASGSVSTATASAPLVVAQQFFDAINRGDVNSATAFFADGSMLITLDRPCNTAPCTSRVQILSVLTNNWVAFGHYTFDLEQTSPSTVTFRGESMAQIALHTFIQVDLQIERGHIATFRAVNRFDCAQAPRPGICAPTGSATPP
jgi:TIR domain